MATKFQQKMKHEFSNPDISKCLLMLHLDVESDLIVVDSENRRHTRIGKD